MLVNPTRDLLKVLVILFTYSARWSAEDVIAHCVNCDE